MLPPGQLSEEERNYLYTVVNQVNPQIVLESGTWYGGGSTLSMVRSLHNLKSKGVLHTWEEHSEFFKVAEQFYMCSTEYKPHIVLHNEDFVDGIKKLSDEFFQKVDMVFLDGGDEAPNGRHKLKESWYHSNYNLSENVQSFKFLEQHLNPGTHVLLHDWTEEHGRGSFVKAYLEQTNNQHFHMINLINATTGLAHLIKK